MDEIYTDEGDSSGDEREPILSYEGVSTDSESEHFEFESDEDGMDEIPAAFQRRPRNAASSSNLHAAEGAGDMNFSHTPIKVDPTKTYGKRPKDPSETNLPSTSTQMPKKDTSLEDDGQTCTICFEQWTNSSEHRLVSLRCGHIFGRSCITRWLKGQSRCPQCNAIARKSEVRNIYAKTLKVLDSTERDKALRDLEAEMELRRKAEINAATERLKYNQMALENERLKRELMDANRLLLEFRSGAYYPSGITQSSSNSSAVPVFILSKCVDIHKNGGCRIIDVCQFLDWAIISQASNNDLFPGYGFRKVFFPEMKTEEFTLIHQKAIKDMAFHDSNGLVLTASLDKTVKLTNLLTNSVVQTYPLELDVWSCTWDLDDTSYFYAGLRTGEIYLFDIRYTNRHVDELAKFGKGTPAASIQYVKKSQSYRKGGLLVGKLSDCAFYQKESSSMQFKLFYPPTAGPYTSMSTDATSGHILVSSRPSPKQPRATHTMCEVGADHMGDFVCNPIQVVQGGRADVLRTRSKLLPHPDDASSLLICAGDEENNGALVWDASSGKCIAQLKTDPSPVFDLALAKVNHKSHLLALTDKSLHVYTWNK